MNWRGFFWTCGDCHGDDITSKRYTSYCASGLGSLYVWDILGCVPMSLHILKDPMIAEGYLVYEILVSTVIHWVSFILGLCSPGDHIQIASAVVIVMLLLTSRTSKSKSVYRWQLGLSSSLKSVYRQQSRKQNALSHHLSLQINQWIHIDLIHHLSKTPFADSTSHSRHI